MLTAHHINAFLVITVCVLAAVAAGRISTARHDSYRRLLLNEE